MKLLLVDSTSHYPANPIFVEAAEELSRRLSLQYEVIDEAKFFPKPSFQDRVVYRILRRRPRQFWRFNAHLIQRALAFQPDMMLIAKGQYVAADTLRRIKDLTGATLVNYATDDPFNELSSSRFVRRAISCYDLYVSTKLAVIPDLRSHGARATAYVRFGYKPSVHRPIELSADERVRFASDVAFIGGADDDRVPFFHALTARRPNVNLRLYGGRWREYPALARFCAGEVYGDDYRRVMAGTRIAINLVRRQNRDDHVMRTFEAPACGAFMLSERTGSHLALMAEDIDAAYFSSPGEMSAKVDELLADPARCEAMAARGRRRIVEGGHTYADRLEEIVGLAGEIGKPARAVPDLAAVT